MGIENKIAPIHLTPVCRSRKSGERGATLLEFTFAMVITFVLIFAMIDFARALYSFHFVSYAAREGARFASMRGATSCNTSVIPCSVGQADIQTYVQQIAPSGITAGAVTVNANPANPNNLPVCGSTPNYPGCAVQVQVSYPFNFIFPVNFYNSSPVSFPAGTINMSSTSQMIISR